MSISFSNKGRTNLAITPILIPLFFLFSCLILFVFATKTAYSEITKKLVSIKSDNEKNEALQAKIEDLKSIDTATFPDSQKILISFPEEDLSLWMLSQLRTMSEQYSLSLSGQKVSFSIPDENGIGKTSIFFNLSGETSDINQFLLDLDKIAPVTTLTKVNYAINDTNNKGAQVAMVVYYAKLPQQYPQLETAVNKLTNEETQTIKRLSEMQFPNFANISANSPFEFKNPF